MYGIFDKKQFKRKPSSDIKEMLIGIVSVFTMVAAAHGCEKMKNEDEGYSGSHSKKIERKMSKPLPQTRDTIDRKTTAWLPDFI